MSMRFHDLPSNDPCHTCYGNPCQNDGVCVNISNDTKRDEKYECRCSKPFFGRHCARWGNGRSQFILSAVGKVCERSITNADECKQAADLLPKAAFVIGQGDGHDMPYGCIYDKTNVKHHHVFWNQAGVAISADKNVREICQEIEDPFEGLDCLKDYRKIRGPDSCQVKPHSKPWMVNLMVSCKNLCDEAYCQKDGICQKDSLQHQCGGTLIGQNIVLTAAHCICYYSNPIGNESNPAIICDEWKKYVAVLGDHDGLNYGIGHINENEQFIEIEHGEPHTKFVESNMDILQGYDLAILILKQKVSYNDRIKKAYLPSVRSSCPSDKTLVVSGWGDPVGYFGESLLHWFEHRFLWSVKQRCLDVEGCLDIDEDGQIFGNPDALLCATGSSNGINSPFFGDSGGPLTYTVDGKTTVIGVVSAGRDQTALYARVSLQDVLGWINALKNKYEE